MVWLIDDRKEEWEENSKKKIINKKEVTQINVISIFKKIYIFITFQQ